MEDSRPSPFGESVPRILAVDDQAGRCVGHWTLTQPFALVGCGPRCDVVLKDPGVSARHVFLQVFRGRVFWVDLDSRSGATVDGVVAKSGWMRPGSGPRIGPYRLRLVEGPGSEADAADPPPNALKWRLSEDGPATSWWLDISSDEARSRTVRRFPIRRALALVGSSKGCRLRIADPRISRFCHALARDAREVWAIDLCSTAGLWINGRRARWVRLEPGDCLEIGPYHAVVGCRASKGSIILPDPLDDAAPEAVSVSEVVLGQPEIDALSMVQMMQQFGQIQDRMFDQFQMAMQMMLNMVGSLHQEQMGRIHQELERLREISSDLGKLQKNSAHDRSRPAAIPAAKPSRGSSFTFGARTQAEESRVDENRNQLSERISILQNEQRAQWQKILGMVQGGDGA